MDNSTTVQYASHIQRLCQQARSAVRDIDPQNDLSFLRIRTKKHEVMVAPGKTLEAFHLIIYHFYFVKSCLKLLFKVPLLCLQTKTTLWLSFKTRQSNCRDLINGIKYSDYELL